VRGFSINLSKSNGPSDGWRRREPCRRDEIGDDDAVDSCSRTRRPRRGRTPRTQYRRGPTCGAQVISGRASISRTSWLTSPRRCSRCRCRSSRTLCRSGFSGRRNVVGSRARRPLSELSRMANHHASFGALWPLPTNSRSALHPHSGPKSFVTCFAGRPSWPRRLVAHDGAVID